MALIIAPVLISSLVLPTAAMAAAPTITSASITGTAQVGQTLTAVANGVTGAPSYTYQWKADGSNVGSASTYIPSNTDAGKTITVKITVTISGAGGGSANATSVATAAVTRPPALGNSVDIVGSAVVGQTLSTNIGAVYGYPTPTLSYEWRADGVVVGTNSTYTILVDDHGKSIIVTVTATNGIGSPASKASTATNDVVGNPGFSSATMTGTAQVGQTLTAVANDVTGSPLNEIEYEWIVRDDSCGGCGGGVTFSVGDGSSTYTVEPGWEGWDIYVSITVSTGSDEGDRPNRRDVTHASNSMVIQAAPASSNADLSALALSSGTLSPTFDSATASYTASVANSVATGYTVTPTTSDSKALFVQYLGSTGTTAFIGALAVGANIIRTVVTAEDGTTTKTYTVTVTRAAASAPPINVIFNANNGTGGWKNQFITAGKATPLLSNTYTRTGYTPNGWNTQADGSGTTYTDGQSVTLALNSGLTLFAKWTANPNTVTFNANGAGTSGIMGNQSINSGAATALTANTYTRTGYTFAGWATNSNGSGTTYSNSQSVTLTSGLNLFARWNAKTNTVFFNSNYGSGNRISQEIISDRATALRANSFTRTGYSFAGWNTQADGLGTPYTNSQSVMITSGLDLFAKWTANPNTVTFNANGAGTSGIMSDQSISSGAATALTANSFSRTGYRFAGWNTQANGSGTTYTNGQIVTLTSGLTLFARWNKN